MISRQKLGGGQGTVQMQQLAVTMALDLNCPWQHLDTGAGKRITVVDCTVM